MIVFHLKIFTLFILLIMFFFISDSLIKSIGKGGNGEVWLGKEKELEDSKEQKLNTKNVEYFTIKRVMYFDSTTKEMMENEIDIIRGFDHPNIVKYIIHFFPNDFLVGVGCLVMEMCEYGSLKNLIDYHLEKKVFIKEEVNKFIIY
jgi:serine/threonine protein kinase